MGKEKLKQMYSPKRIRLEQLTKEKLDKRKPFYEKNGYSIPKWIFFCETLIDKGWDCNLYDAKATVSKYVYISKGKLNFKIRFSNHMPNKNKQQESDSDFYVGISHNGVITTEDLIKKIE